MKNVRCTKLHKALYGLKQATQAWYNKIDGYFTQVNFHKSASEPTLYLKNDGKLSVYM